MHDVTARTVIIETLMTKAREAYVSVEKAVEEKTGDIANMRMIEREIMIRSIDNLWVDHLDAINLLRTGIGLRGYAQRDPLIEYKRETYDMFMQLQNLIQRQVVYSIFKIGVTTELGASVMESDRIRINDPSSTSQFDNPYQNVDKPSDNVVLSKVKDAEGNKVGRNDLCPCGSGKKYKNCHG